MFSRNKTTFAVKFTTNYGPSCTGIVHLVDVRQCYHHLLFQSKTTNFTLRQFTT